jgi:hypothetical protein
MALLFRWLHFLVVTTPGRVVVGIIYVVSGLAYGFSSYTVHYQAGPSGPYHLLVSGDSYYLSTESEQNVYYRVAVGDFQPMPHIQAEQWDKPPIVSLLIEDRAEHFELWLPDGRRLRGKSYRVVQLTLSPNETFTSATLRQHPDGYSVNRWPLGLGSLGFGLLWWLFASLGLLLDWLAKRKGRYGELRVSEEKALELLDKQNRREDLYVPEHWLRRIRRALRDRGRD